MSEIPQPPDANAQKDAQANNDGAEGAPVVANADLLDTFEAGTDRSSFRLPPGLLSEALSDGGKAEPDTVVEDAETAATPVVPTTEAAPATENASRPPLETSPAVEPTPERQEPVTHEAEPILPEPVSVETETEPKPVPKADAKAEQPNSPDDSKADKDVLIDIQEQIRLHQEAVRMRAAADQAEAAYLASKLKERDKNISEEEVIKVREKAAKEQAARDAKEAAAKSKVVNLADKGRPYEESVDESDGTEAPDNVTTIKRIKEKDPASHLEDKDPLDPPRPELTPEQLAERLQNAERARYLASIADAAEKARIENLEEAEQKILTEDFVKDNPREAVSKTSTEEFIDFIASLNPQMLEAFLNLDVEEQDKAIEEAEKTKKVREKRKAQAKAEKKPVPKPIERVAPESSFESGTKKKVLDVFINSLTYDEFAVFLTLPKAERDRMITEWLEANWQKLYGEKEQESFTQLSDEAKLERSLKWARTGGLEFNAIADRFVAGLNPTQRKKFDEMGYEQKLANLIIWERGGDPPELQSTSERFGENEGIQSPTYRMYGIYQEGDGEEYYQITTEHDLQRNARTKKDFKKEGRNLFQRIKLRVEGMWYTSMLKIFNYEAVIAEENKHNQEMIRGIVDTGPDQYERLVFAQKHGDVYLNYEGKEVSSEVVRRAQKWALHNPSRFQALCHYELSKREEPEQAKLWEEIFEMMAHHHYNKYAMYGVVVGLQFMNKPSYLAYKNAVIEWMPEYKKDSHGKPILDDNGNPKKEVYTAETIYERGPLGIKRHKLDGDGNKVRIGDVVRSTQRARFKTTDLILNPGDQEYSEKVPDPNAPGGFRDKYETRYRIIRDPETGEIIRREEYKVKKIIEVKHDKFAHELAGKFMSFQYAFRSADVAIMLDEARLASQTALRLARKGDYHSKEFQAALYTLSRYKFVVDTSRLGGSGSPEGAEGGEQMLQEALQKRQQQMTERDAETIAKAEGIPLEEAFVKAQERRKAKGGYPPRISGTAEANVLFLELADVADEMAIRFPGINKIRKSDYEAIQDEFYAPHGSHGHGHETTSRKIRRRTRKNSDRYTGHHAA